MKTNVWNYCNEYLGYCENRYNGHVYDWKYDAEQDIVHLEWKLGKYSYDLKKNFEKEAYVILNRYPTVCISIQGNLMDVFNKPAEVPVKPTEPQPQPQPKPPIVQPNEPVKPTEPPIHLDPPKPQEEEKNALQGFLDWFFGLFKR